MKIVAVVPMKLNNTRLPQKNTKCFTNGNPLCHYVLETLLSIEEINEVYVFCSDPTIQEYIPKGVKYLHRDENLDLDTTKMNEILLEFADEISADYYVMSHTTAPFIAASSIRKGIHAVVSEEYDSAFAAKKVQDFLWKNGSPFNYDLNAIPRTQDLEIIYEETSGFYIYSIHVIKSMGRRIGNRPCIIEVGEIESIDIDEAEDFEIADAIFNAKYRKGDFRECHT